jgi:hypothetical protein
VAKSCVFFAVCTDFLNIIRRAVKGLINIPAQPMKISKVKPLHLKSAAVTLVLSRLWTRNSIHKRVLEEMMRSYHGAVASDLSADLCNH